MEQHLFIYGTLMDPIVQFSVFGRVVQGQPDRLTGYKKYSIQLGDNVYPIIKPETGHSVEGLVITVTPAELMLIDRYEGDAYRREKVMLASGQQAWVYQA